MLHPAALELGQRRSHAGLAVKVAADVPCDICPEEDHLKYSRTVVYFTADFQGQCGLTHKFMYPHHGQQHA
jgi:hypothetical protein